MNNARLNCFLGLLTCLSLGITPVHAQQWCPPGAEWHYTAAFCAGGCLGNVLMASAGDTLIQNESCTRIERTRTYTAYFNPTVHVDTLSELYTYATAGIVWMFDPQLNAFDTLYDFNALPGDSWQLIHLPEASGGTAFLTVLDSGHVSIDARSLRWLSVQYHYPNYPIDSTYIYLDTLIERIGSTTSYMLPYDFPNGFMDASEGGFFRCYSDDEISYQSPFVQTCDLPLGVTEQTTRPAMVIYPNPGSDHLTIRMPVGEKIQGVLVRDALGRICLHETASVENEIMLDTERLSCGCYSIEVRSTNGQFVRQWIKE